MFIALVRHDKSSQYVFMQNAHERARLLVSRRQLSSDRREFNVHLLPKLQNLRLESADPGRKMPKFLHLLFEHRHSLFERSWLHARSSAFERVTSDTVR